MGQPSAPGVEASGQPPHRDEANGVITGSIAAVGPQKPFGFYGTLNAVVWVELTDQLTLTDGSLTGTFSSGTGVVAGLGIRSTLLPRGATVQTSGATPTIAMPIYTFQARTIANVAKITDIQDTTWLLGATVSGPGLAGTETVSSIATASVLPNSYGQGTVKGTVNLSAAPSTGLPDQKTAPFEFKLAANSIVAGVDAAAVLTGASIGTVGSIQLERSFDGGQTWIVCNVGFGSPAVYDTSLGPLSIAFGEPERGVLYRFNCTALTLPGGKALKYRISATGQVSTTVSVQTL